MMTFSVDPRTRTAVLGGADGFAAGTEETVVVSGVTSPDLATLRLTVWSDAGVKLAEATGFEGPGGEDGDAVEIYTAAFITKTSQVTAAFLGKAPGQRLNCQLVIADEDRQYVFQPCVLRNNPNAVPSPDPVPQIWVTLEALADAIGEHDGDADAHPGMVRQSDFSELDFTDMNTDAKRNAAIRALLAALKGEGGA